jgi:hypothetical protein
MSAEWEAVTKDWVDREREVVLTAAMKHLAKSLREVMTPPRNGASLGAILNAAEFDSVLQDHGLAVVPTVPTTPMRDAWQRGWFRNFDDRYRALLGATQER